VESNRETRAVQRIVSGQFDFVPRPGIDTQGYIVELTLFIKTETFANLEPKGQFAIQQLLQRVLSMQQAIDMVQNASRQATQQLLESQSEQGDNGTGRDGTTGKDNT